MKNAHEPTKCLSVKATLKVIGGKWKPLILFVLGNKKLRFSELARGINGITQKMLTQQLKELVNDGLIARTAYPEVPPRVEYEVTPFGKTLLPIFKSMDEWGKQYEKRQAETA